MDSLTLKYGRGTLRLDASRLGRYQVLENSARTTLSETELIEQALRQPIDSPPLSQRVHPGDKVCVIVSDFTRYSQRPDLFLPYLIRELYAGGVRREDITLLCALGAHDPQTQAEKDLLLGELKHDFTLIEHDCRDAAQLTALGRSRHGTELTLSRYATEADVVVLTGSIIYHDMAGFGGGRKSLLPGVAAYDSISQNHLQVFSRQAGQGLNPDCRLGNLEHNPMHEDMLDACAKLREIFLFNIVLDSENRYFQAVAGDWQQAFLRGCAYCAASCAVPISERADVVIAACGGYPKDINLYQASKGYAAGIEACKPGGTVLLLADCPDGMGAEESVRIIRDYRSQLERELKMRERFVPEAYSGYWICEQAQHYRLALVSAYPDPDELAGSGVSVFRDLDAALDFCYQGLVDPLTHVIPYSMSVVPQAR